MQSRLLIAVRRDVRGALTDWRAVAPVLILPLGFSFARLPARLRGIMVGVPSLCRPDAMSMSSSSSSPQVMACVYRRS
jgi:hypothetical protein